MLMRRTLLGAAVAALALCTPAAAQRCEPKTWLNPTADGTTTVEVWTLYGRVNFWWCPPTATDPKWLSAWGGGLFELGFDAARAAAPRVLAASNPWAQYLIERDAIATKLPTLTPLQACRHTELLHAGCVALRTTDFGPGKPAPLTRTEAVASCGVVPDCGAVQQPVQAWRSTGGYIYAFANGKATPIFSRRAPPGALLDCNLARTTIGTQTLCAIAGGSANEVTAGVFK